MEQNQNLTAWEKMQLDMIYDDFDEDLFIRETETEKTVLLTMITAFGLATGGYADDIHCQLTMTDLFK